MSQWFSVGVSSAHPRKKNHPQVQLVSVDDAELQAVAAGVLRVLCVDDDAAAKAVEAGALPPLLVGF